MKKWFIVAAMCSAPIHANELSTELLSSDVEGVVPNVSSTTDVSEKRTGMIVFDHSTGQFKGYNKSGVWDAMTVPSGNPLTSGGTNYRIESVIIAGASDTSACTGTCTTYRNTGSWVTGVSRTAAGAYTVTIGSTIFGSAPTCQCTARNGGNRGCAIDLSSGVETSTTVRIHTFVATTGALVDELPALTCMGPRQ